MKRGEIKLLFEALSSRFEAEKERLGDLDALLGDGDHGVGMAKGFASAYDAVKALDSDDVGKLFQSAGRALMTAVGGASGPLFATVLFELGKASINTSELTVAALKQGLSNAAASVRRLGKANPGDKTMLDVLLPVSEAVQSANDLATASELAAQTSQEAATNTAKLRAKKGRAQYVQDGGAGHPDPGCVSLAIFFETFFNSGKEAK